MSDPLQEATQIIANGGDEGISRLIMVCTNVRRLRGSAAMSEMALVLFDALPDRDKQVLLLMGIDALVNDAADQMG